MGKKNNKGGNNNKAHERQVRQSLRKRENRLKYGDAKWKQSFSLFLEQLEPQGFTIKDVAGDGNCLFRAFADQLEDNPEQHMKYRQNIMTFIEKNKVDYAPFIDDEEGETFEDYIAEMRKNASWGGNIEIQAASLIYQCNITIHQYNQPRWEIINYVGDKYKMIHLSYHNDEHYASVRPTHPPQKQQKEDGPPKPKMDAVANTHSPEPKNYIDDLTFEIMNATGVTSNKMIREALDDCDGNVEAAIDYLIALSATIEIGPDDESDDTSTTTTTTTTSTSNKKQSKNPYKGQKKKEQEQSQQKQELDIDRSKLTNKQRKELQRAEKDKEKPPSNQRQSHNLDRNSIVDDTVVDLGTLRI